MDGAMITLEPAVQRNAHAVGSVWFSLMHGQAIEQQQITRADIAANPVTALLGSRRDTTSLPIGGLQAKFVRTIEYAEWSLL
jgi:hypothetical protein